MKIFSSRGFTLAEVMVVVVIIGILASAIAINTQSAQRQGRDSRRKADMELVAGSLELYRATNRVYPVQLVAAWQGSGLSQLIPDNLGTLPVDPLQTRTDIRPDSQYRYVTDTTGRRFIVQAELENPNERVTLNGPTQVNCCDTEDDLFYVTGTLKDNDKIYYRVSGR